MRAEDENEIVVVGHLGQHPDLVWDGMRLPLDGDSATARVLRTGRSARVNLSGEPSGAISLRAQRSGAVDTVGAPITVEGRLWGVITANWEGHDLPPGDAEERLAEFASLLDIAIANADAREKLTTSRARVLTAGDEARRKLVRDLHDGVQQRFVNTIITLKLMQNAVVATPEEVGPLVDESLRHAEGGNHELRELAHGILPGAPTRGGLAAGVASLVSRLNLPVHVNVDTPRLPSETEGQRLLHHRRSTDQRRQALPRDFRRGQRRRRRASAAARGPRRRHRWRRPRRARPPRHRGPRRRARRPTGGRPSSRRRDTPHGRTAPRRPRTPHGRGRCLTEAKSRACR